MDRTNAADSIDIAKATALLEAAVFAPEDFPQTLASVGRHLGWDHFCLVHSELERPTFIASEQSLADLNAYAAGGWVEVDYRAANVNLTRPGDLFIDDRVVSEDERINSAIYNELYVPRRMAHFAGWRHEVGGSTWIFSLARATEYGPANQRDVKALCELAPFANRALQLARQMREVRVQGVVDGYSAAGFAAITLDSNGKAQAQTPQAEAMFDTTFGIRAGRLVASNRDLQARLDHLTRLATRSSPQRPIANIVVRRPDGRQPLLIQPLVLRGLGLDALAGVRILLTLTDLETDRTAPTNLLRELFDLSPAEAEVAALLGLGLDSNDIARRRAVGIETVRAQLKSIFRKLQVGRQSELVGLLARINAQRSQGSDDQET